MTAAVIEPVTSVEPQPASLERISANTSSPRPALNVTNPAQSSRRARGSRDSAIRRSVTTSATMPIGRLTRKIQRHDNPLVIAPPSTGPTATATPVTAPNTPNATPRSRPW